MITFNHLKCEGTKRTSYPYDAIYLHSNHDEKIHRGLRYDRGDQRRNLERPVEAINAPNDYNERG